MNKRKLGLITGGFGILTWVVSTFCLKVFSAIQVVFFIIGIIGALLLGYYLSSENQEANQ